MTRCLHYLSPRRLSTPPTASLAPPPRPWFCVGHPVTYGQLSTLLPVLIYLFTPRLLRPLVLRGVNAGCCCLHGPWTRLRGARMAPSIRLVSVGRQAGSIGRRVPFRRKWAIDLPLMADGDGSVSAAVVSRAPWSYCMRIAHRIS